MIEFDERLLLSASCLPYLIASGMTCYVFGARRYDPGRWHMVLILIGFCLHSGFLVLRGQEIGHCPMGNLFELLAFLGWAIALNYVLLGSLFRLSLLGLFTAPLVLLLNFIALSLPGIDGPTEIGKLGYMLELHAALSLLSFGTFGLLAMSGVLFLITDYLLKSRQSLNTLSTLPPIGELEKVSQRVAILGIVLLTIGLGAGFFVENWQAHSGKILWASFVWIVYVGLMGGRLTSQLSPARFAWGTVLCFVFMILTFWGVNSGGGA